jgi:hypothetical protein
MDGLDDCDRLQRDLGVPDEQNRSWNAVRGRYPALTGAHHELNLAFSKLGDLPMSAQGVVHRDLTWFLQLKW